MAIVERTLECGCGMRENTKSGDCTISHVPHCTQTRVLRMDDAGIRVASGKGRSVTEPESIWGSRERRRTP